MTRLLCASVFAFSLLLVGCGKDDMSVPDNAQAGWTEATVKFQMDRCQNRSTPLKQIMDTRKVCRCVIEELAPKMTWTQFDQGHYLQQERARAGRECQKKHWYINNK